MSYERFEKVHVATSKWEGGYVNDPQDPGGKTKYGVTERVWKAWCREQGQAFTPIKDITYKQALAVYYEWYWLAARCDTLQPGVDRMVYDAAVNSGVAQSRKWLMRSIGGSDRDTIKKLHDYRMAFLRSLKGWKRFGKGWTNRVTDIYGQALKDEKELPKLRPEIPEPVKKVVEHVAATERVSKGEWTAGVGAVVAAGKAAEEVSNATKTGVTSVSDLLSTTNLWTLATITLVGFCLFLLWDRRRKRAMAREALE